MATRTFIGIFLWRKLNRSTFLAHGHDSGVRRQAVLRSSQRDREKRVDNIEMVFWNFKYFLFVLFLKKKKKKKMMKKKKKLKKKNCCVRKTLNQISTRSKSELT